MVNNYQLPTSAQAVPVVHLDLNGNVVGGSKSVGTDKSANSPAGPGAASSFTYNGATQNLLVTVAANPSRGVIEVVNTTGALIVVVIDDGSNTAGTVSLLPLVPGSAQ